MTSRNKWTNDKQTNGRLIDDGNSIQNLWESASHARTALRRAEFRAMEADRLSGESSSQSSYWHTIPVERVPSYQLQNNVLADDNAQVFVDKFGRTSHMKQKQFNKYDDQRKTNYNDNKYVQDKSSDQPSYVKSLLGESNRYEQPEHDWPTSIHMPAPQVRNGYSTSSKPHDRASVPVSHTVTSAAYDDSTTLLDSIAYSRRNNDPPSTFIDSTSQYKAPLRYINEVQSKEVPKSDHDIRLGSTKLTHVDVAIPGTKSALSNRKDFERLHSNGIEDYDSRKSNVSRHSKLKDDVSVNVRFNTNNLLNSDKTASDRKVMSLDEVISLHRKKESQVSNGSNSNHLSDVLRRQRLEAEESDDHDEDVDDQNFVERRFNLDTRTRHKEDEQIIPKQYDLHQSEINKAVSCRKVASAPKAPVYKGFCKPDSNQAHLSKPENNPPRVSKSPSRVESNAPDLNLPKKVQKTRVTASKQSIRTHVITPSSWREGQKLISKELGPGRPSKTSSNVQDQIARDTENTNVIDDNRDKLPTSKYNETIDQISKSNNGLLQKPVSNVNVQVKEKGDVEEPRKTGIVLSEETRAILKDVEDHSSSSDSENENVKNGQAENKAESRSKSTSRKGKKKDEEKKTEKVVKVKHYDSDSVRSYIAKKKEEEKQLKRKKEEEERIKKERKEQTLKNLQRPPVQKNRSTGIKDHKETMPGALATYTIEKGASVDFEKGAYVDFEKANSESDKENRHVLDGVNDSNNHTRETRPYIVPNPLEFPAQSSRYPMERAIQSGRHSPPERESIMDAISNGGLQQNVTHRPMSQVSNRVAGVVPSFNTVNGQDLLHKFTLNTGLSKDDVIKKFADRAANQPSMLSTSSKDSYRAPSSLPDKAPPPQPVSSFGMHNRKEEIIRNITTYSNILKNRLTIETEKLRLMTQDGGLMESSMSLNEQPFQSRLDRLSKPSAVVFESDLPGVTNISSLARQYESKPRQEGMVPKSDKSSSTAVKKDVLKKESQSSLFTNNSVKGLTSQLTKPIPDIEQESYKFSFRSGHGGSLTNKIGSGLLETEYCAGKSHKEFEVADIPPPRPHRVQIPVTVAWEKPDQYNFFNIYTRKLRDASGDATGEFLSAQPSAKPVPFLDNNAPLTYRALFSKPSSATGLGSQPLVTGQSQFKNEEKMRLSSPDSISSEEFTAAASRSERSEQEERSRSKRPDFSSSREKTDIQSRSVHDKKTDIQSRSVKDDDDDYDDHTITSSMNSSDVSGVSSAHEEEEKTNKHADMNVPRNRTGGMVGYSPAVLSQRLTLALNQLEGTDESLRQLTEIDRVRAVSLAQQETVSLAQILKARQQQQQMQLNEIQAKAREDMLRAERDLEETKRREETISMQNRLAAEEREALVRLDAQEKMIRARLEADEKAAKARIELAASQLPPPVPFSQTKKQDQSVQYSLRTLGDGVTDSTDEQSTQSQASEISDSDSATPVPSPKEASSSSKQSVQLASNKSVSEVVTASDASVKAKVKENASIATESDVEEVGSLHSHTESVSEDVQNDEDQEEIEYSAEFETSVAEDIDKSMRDVLPSEEQRKKLKKSTSQSSTEDTHHVTQGTNRRLSFGEDSFEKFTLEMLMQYMQSEELRAQHQAALLKLREKALKEKTKAELAWLEQQKRSLKDNKIDEVYPQLKEKQKGLLRRQKQEEEEIKRMKAAYQAASEERQRMLLQSQDIVTIKKSTQQVLKLLRTNRSVSGSSAKLVHSSSATISSDASNIVSTSERQGKSGDKASKSLDSSENERPASPSSELKKLDQQRQRKKLDEKHLTAREQLLHQRKKKLEELIEWKKRLDEEEARVSRLEEKTIKEIQSRTKSPEKSGDKELVSARSTTTVESEISQPAVSTARSQKSTVPSKTESVSEEVSTAKSVKSAADNRTASISEEVSTAHSQKSTGNSKTSVHEEILTARSDVTAKEITSALSETKSQTKTVDESVKSSEESEEISESISEQLEENSQKKSKKSKSSDSSGESTVKSASANYSNETFESAPASRVASASADFKRRSSSERRTSYDEELQSEDLFTASDISEAEERVKMLNDTLKKLKEEALRLKMTKKSYKEKLTEDEVALTKKIESYNEHINRAKAEIERHTALEAHKSADVREKRKENINIERRGADSKVPADVALGSIAEESEHSSRSTHHEKEIPVLAQATPRDVPSMPVDEIADVPLTARTDKDVSEDIKTEVEDSKQVDEDHSGASVKSERSKSIKEKLNSEKSVESVKSISHLSESISESKVSSDEKRSPDVETVQSKLSIKSEKETTVEEENKTSDSDESSSGDSSSKSVSKSKSTSERSISRTTDASKKIEKEEVNDDVVEDIDEEVKEEVEVSEKESAQHSLSSSTEAETDDEKAPPLFIDLHAHVEPLTNPEMNKEATEEGMWKVIEEKNKLPSDKKDSNASNVEEDIEKSALEHISAKADIEAKLKEAEKLTVREAIDKIINVRKEKIRKEAEQIKKLSEQLPLAASEKQTKPENLIGDVDLDNDNKGSATAREGYSELTSLSNLPDILGRSANKQSAAATADAISKLYSEFEGFGEGWMEEDDELFGGHLPPPYPQDNQQRAAPHPDLKLDLSQLDTKRPVPEKVLPVVPHNEAEVSQLVTASLDVFWEKRRYGESWKGVVPPSSYLLNESGNEKIEASRKAYKNLVFDLTGEILTDLYNEEIDDATDRPWASQLSSALRSVSRMPPTTLPEVRPIVNDQVTRLLGVNQRLGRPTIIPKVLVTRRRQDNVDRILYQELQEEEPNWISYDKDELEVKMQLTDAIMDLLLTETVTCISEVCSKK